MLAGAGAVGCRPMIGPDDIDAFRDEHQDALNEAAAYARRAAEGLPVDRWSTTQQAILVAKGIRALTVIIAIQTATIEELAHGDTPSKR